MALGDDGMCRLCEETPVHHAFIGCPKGIVLQREIDVWLREKMIAT